jgi:hypothetical protein
VRRFSGISLRTNMSEKPVRLAPKGETLRELFLKSGNLCAFPGCGHLMMNEKGIFIGQVCHIEAEEEGGERFNSAMTNEQRRAASNLMLMCYAHHQETNNVKKFSVKRLRQFKADHEGRFSNPDRAILEKLTDWTTVHTPLRPTNLNRLNKLLRWNYDAVELKQSIDELNQHIDILARVPMELRRFLGAVASRAHRMKDTGAVQSEIFGTKILASDVKSAFQLGQRTIASRTTQLDAYGLADIDQINTDLGPQPAVRIRTLESGWPLWLDLAAFCETAPEPMSVFTDDLDFSRLDD